MIEAATKIVKARSGEIHPAEIQREIEFLLNLQRWIEA